VKALSVVFCGSLLGCGLILGLKDPNDEPVPGPGANEDGGITEGDSAAFCANVDLQNDERHCGKCGRDCQGSKCRNGQCEPVVLATDEGTPRQLAVNGDGVYWVSEQPDAGAIRGCALAGCTGGAQTILSSRGDANTLVRRGTRIVADKANVYWLGSTQLLSCSTKGCGLAPKELIPVYEESQLGRSHGETLQYTIYPSEVGQFYSGVATCRMPNCADPKVLLFSARKRTPIVSNKDFAYWITLDDDATDIAIDAIGRSPLPDGGPELINRQVRVADLELDPSGTILYWLGNEQLSRCALPGCEASTEVLAPTTEDLDGLAADATDVYFTRSDGIYKCAAEHCKGGATLVASSAGEKPSLAVDGTSVYWTNPKERTVMRVVK
jgi:hypothetical protein